MTNYRKLFLRIEKRIKNKISEKLLGLNNPTCSVCFHLEKSNLSNLTKSQCTCLETEATYEPNTLENKLINTPEKTPVFPIINNKVK